MKLKLKTRHLYGESQISSNCPEAEAFFYLLRRAHLKPDELPWLNKMGFEIEITGETRDLSMFIQDQEYENKGGKIVMEPKCPTCGKER